MKAMRKIIARLLDCVMVLLALATIGVRWLSMQVEGVEE